MSFISLKKYISFLINNIFTVLVVGIPLIYCFVNNVEGDYVILNNYKEISKFFVFSFFLSPEVILPKGIKGDINLVSFYMLSLFAVLLIAGLIFLIAPFNISFLILLVGLNLIGFLFYSIAVAQSKLKIYLLAQGFSIIISSICLFVLNIELLSFYFLYSFLLATTSIFLFFSSISIKAIKFSAYNDYFRVFKSYYSKYYKFSLVTVIGIIVTLSSRYYFQYLYGVLEFETYDLINSTVTLAMGVLSQSYISFKLFAVSKKTNSSGDILVFVFLLCCLLSFISIDVVSLSIFKVKLTLTVIALLFMSESLKLISLRYTISFINNDKYGTLAVIAICNLFFIGISILIAQNLLKDVLVVIFSVNLASVIFNLVISHFIYYRLKKKFINL
ncbi:hypothetical protein N9S96_00205 [Flavobacteriales bacterium]|nr:hypothetical protein [Flavobacteriales bacterium]